jgi:hypothetical protein
MQRISGPFDRASASFGGYTVRLAGPFRVGYEQAGTPRAAPGVLWLSTYVAPGISPVDRSDYTVIDGEVVGSVCE